MDGLHRWALKWEIIKLSLKEKKKKQKKLETFQFIENIVFKQQMLKMHTTAEIFAANFEWHVQYL